MQISHSLLNYRQMPSPALDGVATGDLTGAAGALGLVFGSLFLALWTLEKQATAAAETELTLVQVSLLAASSGVYDQS